MLTDFHGDEAKIIENYPAIDSSKKNDIFNFPNFHFFIEFFSRDWSFAHFGALAHMGHRDIGNST